MQEFTWYPSWSVGEARLDREHQNLISIINALGAALRVSEIQMDQDWFTHEVLSELVAYAENHFRYEEAVMEAAGFPDLTRHRDGHLFFRQQVMDLASEVGWKPQAVADLHTFLTAWLRHHILEEDLRYAPFLAARWDHPSAPPPG